MTSEIPRHSPEAELAMTVLLNQAVLGGPVQWELRVDLEGSFVRTGMKFRNLAVALQAVGASAADAAAAVRNLKHRYDAAQRPSTDSDSEAREP